jgi:plastocyanin
MKRLLPLVALALLLPACGGGGGGGDRAAETAVDATGPADAQVAEVVSNDQLTYDPGIVNAKVGTLELSHRNSGSIPHNLVFDDKKLGAIDTVTEGQTKKMTLTFSQPGTYDFVCTFHSGQEGKVVVS